MKPLIKKFPNTTMFVLAIVLFAFTLIVSVIINKGIVKQYFPYIAPILLFVTTLFLYKREGKTLSAIGLNFNIRNLSFMPLGILIGTFAFFGAKYLRALFVGETFELSTSIDYSTIFTPSILFYHKLLPKNYCLEATCLKKQLKFLMLL